MLEKKEIRDFVASGAAVDITNYSFNAVNALRNAENGFELVGTCRAPIGITGGICRGYNTGTLYAVTARNSTLFQIF